MGTLSEILLKKFFEFWPYERLFIDNLFNDTLTTV
jgi:hypothetical protein